MAGVLNTTERQYNLKCVYEGRRLVIRLIPGLNDVPESNWATMLKDPYVKGLVGEGKVIFNDEVTKRLETEEPLASTKIDLKSMEPETAKESKEKAEKKAREAQKEKDQADTAALEKEAAKLKVEKLKSEKASK